MSQSGYIAALLLAAFVLYLAINNRLVKYAAVLWGATVAPLPSATGNNTGGTLPLPGAGGLAGSAPTATTGGLPGIPDFSGSGASGIGGFLQEAAPFALEFL